MKESDFESLVRQAYATQLPMHPQHPERTLDCPTLTRFLAGGGWTAVERAHVGSCPYCQKTTAMLWRVEPPDWTTLARYALAPDDFPDRRAIEIYLQDAGLRCELVRHFLRLHGGLGEAAEAALTGVTGFFVSLPPPATGLAEGAPESRSFSQTYPASEEQGLSVSIARNALDMLAITVDTNRPPHAGEHLQIELIGLGEPLSCDVSLEPHQGGGRARYVFGPLDAIVQQLGPECFVAISPARLHS